MTDLSHAAADRFTGVRAFSAGGARVGIMTCRHCGSAILLDPSDTGDYPKAHIEWHDWLDRAEQEPER